VTYSRTGTVAVKAVLGCIIVFGRGCWERSTVEIPADTRRRTSGYVGSERQSSVTAHHVRRYRRKRKLHRRTSGRRHLDSCLSPSL